MNKTRKIVEGAILLAILGALMFMDIRLAGMLSTFITFILPVIIIIYTSRYDFKDGIIFGITILLFCFVSGFLAFNPETIIYYPIGIIVGLGYSYGVKRNFNKRSLLLIAITLFIIGEILATFLFMPLFGLNLTEILKSTKDMVYNMNFLGNNNPELNQAYELALHSLDNIMDSLLLGIYVLVTILSGLMEGFIIHFLSVTLLKRFKIKDLGNISLFDQKPNILLSYISFISFFSIFFINRLENETIKLIFIILSLLGLIVLLYYGYLFVLLYGRIVLKRNLTLILILGLFLFTPITIMILVVLGFLYGSGPLRNYLESKRYLNENNK